MNIIEFKINRFIYYIFWRYKYSYPSKFLLMQLNYLTWSSKKTHLSFNLILFNFINDLKALIFGFKSLIVSLAVIWSNLPSSPSLSRTT